MRLHVFGAVCSAIEASTLIKGTKNVNLRLMLASPENAPGEAVLARRLRQQAM
jgi:hypothetical protein